jgi:hypothetical protein
MTERGAHDDDDPLIVLTQGLRGHLHLRAQPTEEQMQGLRGRLHLRAQPRSKWALLWVRGFFGPKDCGGASICEHNRQRSTCKDCGGASICEHNRRRSACKDCVQTAGAPSSASTQRPCWLLHRLLGYYTDSLATTPTPSCIRMCQLATTPTPFCIRMCQNACVCMRL